MSSQRLPFDEERAATAAAVPLAERLRQRTRLTDFIRQWRDKQGRLISARAFVPWPSKPGEAFQFDWSEEGLVVGGIYDRMQVSHLKLSASRAFWLVAYPQSRPRGAVRRAPARARPQVALPHALAPAVGLGPADPGA